MSIRRSPKRTTNGRNKIKPAVQPRILLLSDVKKEYMLVNMSLRLAQNGCKQITGMLCALSTFSTLLCIVKHRSYILPCDRDLWFIVIILLRIIVNCIYEINGPLINFYSLTSSVFWSELSVPTMWGHYSYCVLIRCN